jgi:AcrR family transcriptional regulator
MEPVARIAWPATSTAPTRSDLLDLARERYLRGARLDMQAMAAELGVSRTTVYRWAGNQDQLLGEVISGLAHETFRAAEKGVRQRGRARVLMVFGNVMRRIAGNKGVQAALLRDPPQFLRVVTNDGPVNRAATMLCAELLQREVERGTLVLVASVDELASAMIRIGETGLYADMLAGVEPDIDGLLEIVALLLLPPT